MIYVCVCNDGDCDNFDIRPDDVCQANEHRMRVEKFVPLAIHRGTVSALEKYGQHHVGCSGAIHRDGKVLGCACGFANALTAVRGR
jgi:hypothetical protein